MSTKSQDHSRLKTGWIVNESCDWVLAASTLGVLEESLTTAVETMVRHGVRGVELRSAEGSFVDSAATAAERERVREAFTNAGINILSVASGVKIAAVGDDDEVIGSLESELRLAADLGARHVRVFPGAPTAGLTPYDALPILRETVSDVDARAVRRLVPVLDLATALAVSVAVETHDSHPRGEDVARLLGALDHAAPGHRVGAIWDVLHPWRVGEDLATTAALLAPYLVQERGYVQLKDASSRTEPFPLLQGHGAVPTAEFLTVIDAAGYAGPISLEWPRFWSPSAPSLDLALGAAAAVLAAHPRRRRARSRP